MFIVSVFSLLGMCCVPHDIFSGEAPLLVTHEKIAQHKKWEVYSWLTSFGLAAASFSAGCVMTTNGVAFPESETGEKLAWSMFGLSTSMLVYNWYKFWKTDKKDIMEAVRLGPSYLLRPIGSLTLSSTSLACAIGYAGNSEAMGNILCGLGVLSLALDTAIPYVRYRGLCIKEQEWLQSAP